MRLTRWGRVSVVGVVALLLVVAALAPVAWAQDGFAPLAGQWVGNIVWPSGSSGETVWRIGTDGTFSIETDQYTAYGSLKPAGTGYAFTYTHEAQDYTGTLATEQANGQLRLVGRGEGGSGGPMNITLTRAR